MSEGQETGPTPQWPASTHPSQTLLLDSSLLHDRAPIVGRDGLAAKPLENRRMGNPSASGFAVRCAHRQQVCCGCSVAWRHQEWRLQWTPIHQTSR
jgi:hypothetical protein